MLVRSRSRLQVFHSCLHSRSQAASCCAPNGAPRTRPSAQGLSESNFVSDLMQAAATAMCGAVTSCAPQSPNLVVDTERAQAA